MAGGRRAHGGALLAALASALVALAAAASPAVGSPAAGSPAAAATDPLSVSVLQTDPGIGQDLASEPNLEFSSTAPPAGIPLIAVQDGTRYQQVTGFGAAMTDSSAWLIERKLSPTAKRQLISKLMSPGGLHLSWLRLPIGASDYTANGKPYSYDDMPPGQSDPSLSHFSIAHDKSYVIPAIKLALQTNPQLRLLATPWSPPAWMKANDSLSDLKGGGTLLGQDYGHLAQYFVKFLQAYAQAGIKVGAISPQNEPGNPTAYPGTNLSEPAEANLITQDLVPALAAAHLHPQLWGSELGWKSQQYAEQLAKSPAGSELTGISWHCYYGSPNVMSTVRAARPSLGTIVSECAPGISAIPVSEVVISSLRNWASAVSLWNLALEPNGGPVEEPNTGCPGCTGLVTINPQNGSVSYTSSFYELAQASAYIEPGAHRVASNTFDTYDYLRPGVNFISPGLDDVAFVNPDGTRVLLAYNNGAQPLSFAIGWDGRYVQYTLPAGATTTFVWDAGGS
jgi:O-glycosyl hydrolase